MGSTEPSTAPLEAASTSCFTYGGEGTGGIDTSNWKVVAASVTGPSHTAKGVVCDDAASAAAAGSWLIATVCDGAGSARFGAVGAALVSATVVESIRDQVASESRRSLRTTIEAALDRGHAAITEAAAAHATSTHEFASTVVGALCRDGRGVLFHIGDGTAIVSDRSGRVMAVSHGTPKEYANETHFLSHGSWRKHLQLTALWAVESLMLMTDGVTPFVLEAQNVKDTFVQPIAQYLRTYPHSTGEKALQKLLNTDAARRQVADDKTLLWAGRNRELA